MSAVAARVALRDQERFLISEIDSNDPSLCASIIVQIKDWINDCEHIIIEHPSLEGRDLEIVSSARQMYRNICLKLQVAFDCYSRLSGLCLCHDSTDHRLLSVAMIDYTSECFPESKAHEKTMEILELVTNPYNLALSFFPDRIKGAGSALVQRVIQIAQEHFYVGIIVATLDSAKLFYEKCSFQKVNEDDPDDNIMILRIK
jgi:hypothetical protein